MHTSTFDIFKIGIGPSSSHTMGPMLAARRFLDELKSGHWPRPARVKVERIVVRLHGSLAYTGRGHATDRAVILGLNGHAPDSINPDEIASIIEQTSLTRTISLPDHNTYSFDPATDLVFDRKTPLPGHPNGMTFEALDEGGHLALRRHYFSVGGGTVLRQDELESRGAPPAVPDASPFPFRSGREMLDMAEQSGLSIGEMQMANELQQASEREVNRRLDEIWQAMRGCIDRGLARDDILPGGLNVRRRAGKMHQQLLADRQRNETGSFATNDWLSVFAMAVNEENAAGGRVVTAPTNGAAGVVPAVIAFAQEFVAGVGPQAIRSFLLTAAAVGSLIKANASVSGAEVGCQGEVGSASAMAAAGLCALMGGTPAQIENAAEIAMEHHLGMTCDPIKGLVQVPCIERNAMGAVKAATAASLAMRGDGEHLVSLDVAIETMRQTGLDMHEKYKETSSGGLAVNYVEC
jgi:L-serine dehydratase